MSRQLVLGATTSRGGDHWSADDFDVRLGHASGQVIGQIFLTPMASMPTEDADALLEWGKRNIQGDD